jgi:hypothetical protein
MWDYVGIVRTTKRLQRAQHRIRLLEREINEFYSNFRVSHDLIELRNLVLTADLIVQCALKRRESRGLHFSRDYPELLEVARNSRLRKRRPLRDVIVTSTGTWARNHKSQLPKLRFRHLIGKQDKARSPCPHLQPEVSALSDGDIPHSADTPAI